MNYIMLIRYIWHQIDKLHSTLLLFFGSRNIVSLTTKSVFYLITMKLQPLDLD